MMMMTILYDVIKSIQLHLSNYYYLFKNIIMIKLFLYLSQRFINFKVKKDVKGKR